MEIIQLFFVFSILFAFCTARKFLSEEQVNFFEENGYLVLRGFPSTLEMDDLKSQMGRLIEDWTPSTAAVTLFLGPKNVGSTVCLLPVISFVVLVFEHFFQHAT